MKHFFLFRHGETTYNIQGLIQGQTNNSVLTPKGIEQAYQVGEKLKKYPIDILISSPLKRAQQTANEVLKSFNFLPIQTDNRFTEVNVGEIEGLHYKIVQEKFKEKYNNWRSLDEKYLDLSFTGGESKRQVRTRVFNGLNEYARNSALNFIAISGHGILISQVLLALKQPIKDVPNGSILHLTYQDNQWNFESFITK